MLKRLFGRDRSEPKSEPVHIFPPTHAAPPQHTDAQLLFLSKFHEPQDAAHYRQSPNMHGWRDVLNEWPDVTLTRFESSGYLTKSDVQNTVIACYTVAQLKAEMKQVGLKQSGTKRELVDRLHAAQPDRIQALADGKTAYQCTQLGIDLVTPFVDRQTQEREQAEVESLSAVRNGELKRAAIIVAAFEQRQVFKRGMGVDWSKYPSPNDLLVLHQVTVDKSLPEDAKTASIMMHLWGIGADEAFRKWMPNYQPSKSGGTKEDGPVLSFKYRPFQFIKTAKEELMQDLIPAKKMFASYPVGLRARLLQDLALSLFGDMRGRSLGEITAYGEEADRLFSTMVDRNMDGIAFEKSGDYDAAIHKYSANVIDGFEGTHPYDRLRVIYSRAHQYDDAILVCQAALDWNSLWTQMGWSAWEKVEDYQAWIDKLNAKKSKKDSGSDN